MTKRLTIKTTEVDVLDTQWMRAMWVNIIGTKNLHPILHACVSKTSTSIVFIVRRSEIRLFSYITKSIRPLFYDITWARFPKRVVYGEKVVSVNFGSKLRDSLLSIIKDINYFSILDGVFNDANPAISIFSPLRTSQHLLTPWTTCFENRALD